MTGIASARIPTQAGPVVMADHLNGPDEARRVEAKGWMQSVRAWMVVLPVDVLMLLLPLLWSPQLFKATIATAGLTLLMFTGGGRYRARLHLSVMDELPRLLRTLLTVDALVAIPVALRHDNSALGNFLVGSAVSLGLVVAGRVVTTGLIHIGRRRRITRHRTVVIGGGQVAAGLVEILDNQPRYGLAVVGYVDGGAVGPRPQTRRLGSVEDLDELVRESGADVLLIADGDLDEKDVLAALTSPDCARCDQLIVPRLHLLRTHGGLTDHIGTIPVMRIGPPNLNGLSWLTKRLFDIVVAGTLLLLFSPVLAGFALAIRLESGPGVIFRQTRVGRHGKEFDCLKLRSMRPAGPADSATTWSIAADPRVTSLGRFLRRTSIDELPQLWNVLRGDMTLVGPRPERPHFVRQFSEQYDQYAQRHRVRAGLTGLAQVSGLRGNTSIEDRASYDNYYIENWSLWLDLKILVRTFAEVFFARGR